MGLDIPRMPSLFGHSRAVGDGMNPDAEEAIREEANVSRLMHSGHGVIGAGSEVEIDSHTFSQGDFESGDAVHFLVINRDNSGVGNGKLVVRFSDDKQSADTIDFANEAAPAFYRAEFDLVQKVDNDTDFTYIGFGVSNIDNDDIRGNIDLFEEKAITKKWTISLRGNANTSGTLEWWWWCWRRGHSG